MKKILILAYDFPPYVSVGGLRPFSWFRYLPEFGAFPIVVTRQWSNKYANHLDYVAPSDTTETIYEENNQGLIIRTPFTPNFSNRLLIKYGDSKFNLLRKGVSVFYDYGQFVFPIGPKSIIYTEAEKYIQNNKVDIIIATGEPYILFEYASKLSKKYNVPWIADYRDPWTQDKSRKNKGFSQKCDAYLEKKILHNASAITTVSEFFQQQISTLISDKPFYIIQNGYDDEEVEKVKGIEQSRDKLKIAIVGTLYKWHPVESILQVCSDFVDSFPSAPDFELNFYGINLAKEIEDLVETKFQGLKSIVNIHRKISNEEFLEKLASNNVFLLFNEYTTVGTKIYNFLALKRQIILCYADDPQANELKNKYYSMDEEPIIDINKNPQIEIIKATNSGIIIKDSNHLGVVLKKFYEGFQVNREIPCNSADTEKYSRKLQVKKLVEIIDETLESYKARRII